MEFFDCNVRLGSVASPPPVVPPYECEQIVQQLAELAITDALVYHSWAKQWHPAPGNQRLLEEIASYEQLYPCFVALPEATSEMPPPAELAAQAKDLHGAVRVYPLSHGFELAPWCCESLLTALATAKVPLLVELQEINWRQLKQILTEYPTLPVIVLAAGYRVTRRIFPLWEQHDNLYLEHNTYKQFWGIEDVCMQFGAERLIFGTNFPVSTLGSAIAPLTYSKLSDDEKQLIATANLRRLLNLEG